MVKSEEPPERCYDPVEDGKSGNMKLPVLVVLTVAIKNIVIQILRGFAYSTGVRFLTKVVNEPKVPEIDL
jgi:hypothetical protein